jgi:hypothetical protein
MKDRRASPTGADKTTDRMRFARVVTPRIPVLRRPLTVALLLSLLMHAALLGLVFGGHGLGLPGFGFPWQERRVEAPDLRIVLVPARLPPAQPAGPTDKAPPPPAARATAAPAPSRKAAAAAPVVKRKVPGTPTASTPIGAPAVKERRPARRTNDPAPAAAAEPVVAAIERADESTWAVPGAPPRPAPVTATAPAASSPDVPRPAPAGASGVAQARAESDAARVDAERQEATRLAAAQQET